MLLGAQRQLHHPFEHDTVCMGEALITVTHELLAQLGTAPVPSQGLPGYTLERAPGESWRSKLDSKRNIIVINNGHRDFVYASRSKSLKLRYLVRLYAKELVIHNFVGLPADQRAAAAGHVGETLCCAVSAIISGVPETAVAAIRRIGHSGRT
jgi:hypothetical protein